MARAAASGRSRARRGSSATGALTSVLFQECVGLALLALVGLAGLSVWSYDPADPVLALEPVQNAGGSIGATLAAGLQRSVGVGAWLLLAALAVVGGRLTAGRGLPELASRFWLGAPLLLCATSTLLPLLARLDPTRFSLDGGGWLGTTLSGAESFLVGSWGALLLNLTLLAMGALIATGLSTSRALSFLGMGLGWLLAGLAAIVRRAAAGGLAAVSVARDALVELWQGIDRGWRSLGVRREQRARRARVAAARGPDLEGEDEAVALAASDPSSETEGAPRARRGRRGEPQIVEHGLEQERPREPDHELADPREEARGLRRLRPRRHGAPGPVITMYEFEPGAGVKVNRITNLSDDLALALRALSVRIIAPLPGKSVVGIEIPNPERDVVYIRDLLESRRSARASPSSPSRSARTSSAIPWRGPGAMPHLLVAGATGTGKSVFLNSLLCSILFRASPTS
jgi:DNA segregation ATPase FtsK/SpoIIIE, S-DNA-T family